LTGDFRQLSGQQFMRIHRDYTRFEEKCRTLLLVNFLISSYNRSLAIITGRIYWLNAAKMVAWPGSARWANKLSMGPVPV
jgi:hypothetical protein